MSRKKFIIISFLPLLFSCKHHNRIENPNTFNAQYSIADIPGQREFLILDKYDKQVDKVLSAMPPPQPFKYNRSRIIKITYVDGKPQHQDKPFDAGAPMLCNCLLHNDSLAIIMSAGLFGGFGFNVEVSKDRFDLKYFEEIDNDYFKADPNATAFTRHIEIGSKYQSLILNTEPTFKDGQQLTGLATYTSNTYYTNGSPNMDTVYVSGKFYFMCQTKSVNK